MTSIIETLREFVRPTNLMERLLGIRKINWKFQSKSSKLFSIIKVYSIFFTVVFQYSVRNITYFILFSKLQAELFQKSYHRQFQ